MPQLPGAFKPLSDGDVDAAILNPAEDICDSAIDLFGSADVVHHCGPGQEQRAASVQPVYIDRLYRAARVADQSERPSNAESIHAVVERGLPHTVIYNRGAVPTGDLVDTLNEVTVINDVICAVRAGDFGLFLT